MQRFGSNDRSSIHRHCMQPIRPRSSSARQAFTLMELMLVLALVVLAGAVIVPATAAMLAQQRLSSGAETIRSGLIQARLEAMRSGRPQVFQCSTGSGQISVQPWVDPADATEAADMAGSAAPGSMVATPLGGVNTGESLELPEDVVCESVQIDMDSRVMPILNTVVNTSNVAVAPAATSAAPGTPVVGTGAPATPVVLYPDGTATDALITLSGPSGKVQIRLRGLTGDITRVEL